MQSPDELFDDPGPRDACGVFGVWAPGEEVAKLTYFGLYALQHRGQESAGMSVSNGERIMVFKDMGLVSQVFDEPTLNSLNGYWRSATAATPPPVPASGAMPSPRSAATAAGGLALAHNGNLTNTDELEAWLATSIEASEVPHKDGMDSTSDTALVTALMAVYADDGLKAAALQCCPGCGCVLPRVLDEKTLFAARDPQGIHPLVLGRLERGWVVASETAALDIVGATLIREIEPGELISIDEAGLSSVRFAEADPKGCLFEYVYLARPDTLIADRTGARGARRDRPHAGPRVPGGRRHGDPDAGVGDTPSAIGYAEASGIPFGLGLVKNSYVGRTFIQPSRRSASWASG